MLSLLINLLIALLIIGVVWWIFVKIAAMLGLPSPIVEIAQIVLVVVCLILLVSVLSGLAATGVGWHPFWRSALPLPETSFYG
jgi:hypothetical protein